MPRGAPSTAAISKTPSASDQLAATGPTRLSVLSTSSTSEKDNAPRIGPNKVPTPPSTTIMMAMPD